MTKPLHEQLRGIRPGSFTDDLAEIAGAEPQKKGEILGELFDRTVVALADRIENEYLPLPCDEEGKPWKVGDPVIDFDGSKSTITGLKWDGEEWLILSRWGGKDDGVTSTASSCKRPDPPVLDADGVEIKSDDTVYGTGREQHRYTVQVPYSINKEYGERFCVQCYDHDAGNIVWCDPSMLTHKEPDTLEKLRDDIRSYYGKQITSDEVCEWEDRLTTLIERGDNA